MQNEDITKTNQQNGTSSGQSFNVKQALPNSTGVLVMGILSIVLCWCYGFIALVLGIIALVLSNKSMSLYNENPELYTQASFNNLKSGRITAIIGLCLSAVWLIFVIIYVFIIGAAFTLFPWEMYNY
ncbi:MAG: hypothetical protein K8R58_15565 [Bacteroidales bacterium]|nr:hypothetical protein [Bacteroidales bacterium]